MSRRFGDTASVLEKARAMIAAGDPAAAFMQLRDARQDSPEVRNARAVCLLRLGQIEEAVKLLRDLVVMSGTVTLDPDAPAVYKTNFASALLLAQDPSACLAVLFEVRDEQNAAAERLRAAIRNWKKSLSLFNRLRLALTGSVPGAPIRLDFPPGDLPDPHPTTTTAA